MSDTKPAFHRVQEPKLTPWCSTPFSFLLQHPKRRADMVAAHPRAKQAGAAQGSAGCPGEREASLGHGVHLPGHLAGIAQLVAESQAISLPSMCSLLCSFPTSWSWSCSCSWSCSSCKCAVRISESAIPYTTKHHLLLCYTPPKRSMPVPGSLFCSVQISTSCLSELLGISPISPLLWWKDFDFVLTVHRNPERFDEI